MARRLVACRAIAELGEVVSVDILLRESIKVHHEGSGVKEARRHADPADDSDGTRAVGISARPSDHDLPPPARKADPWLSRGWGMALRHRQDRSLAF